MYYNIINKNNLLQLQKNYNNFTFVWGGVCHVTSLHRLMNALEMPQYSYYSYSVIYTVVLYNVRLYNNNIIAASILKVNT